MVTVRLFHMQLDVACHGEFKWTQGMQIRLKRDVLNSEGLEYRLCSQTEQPLCLLTRIENEI